MKACVLESNKIELDSSTKLNKVQKSSSTKMGKAKRNRKDYTNCGSSTSSCGVSQPVEIPLEAEIEDQAEMKEYLNKLQDLVPFTPKNKTLSKLEVITSAIFYIRDLRDTLGLPQYDDDDFEDDLPNTYSGIEDPHSSPSQTSSFDGNVSDSAKLPPTDTEAPGPQMLPRCPSLSSESRTPVVSPLADQCFSVKSTVHSKRQPLCIIPSPNNTPVSNELQRLSQKS